MASEVDIANLALTLLGEERIMSLADDIKPAREASAVFGLARDSMQGGWTWSFTKTRADLPKLATPPLSSSGYGVAYQMPVDLVRLIMVGTDFVGIDLTDYRGGPTNDFSVEGRLILTNLGDPLPILYAKRVTDTTQFPPTFVTAFAGELAAMLAEPLTQSNEKRSMAEAYRDRMISLAIRANAIELPPQHLADDSWIISRL